MMTEYNPIFRSPIAAVEIENRKSKIQNLKLVDVTGIPGLLGQGEAGDILQKHVSPIPAKPGGLVEVSGGLLARLTPTEFYLFGASPAAQLPSATALNDSFTQAKRFAHVTDVTHGLAALTLTGPAAAGALSKICVLDFHDSVFPNMQFKQSSAAKIKTLVARCDEGETPVYHLHVNRPFGQYFWDIVWDAGQEFGIVAG